MSVAIGIIISVIVSTVVSAIISRLGRNENSMEKIKRYADNRQAGFDTYFEEQKNKLNLLASDLETKDIQAKAAVKRMQVQIDECDKIRSSFEAPVSAIQNIEEKIKSYDNALSELMEMTKAVEVNLDSVKKESQVIEKVNQRLVRQQRNADELEKTIASITKDFSVKNAEQLKTIGTDLLEKYEQRAQECEKTTSVSMEQNKAIMEKIKDDIKVAYSNAITNAKQLEDAAFKNLNTQFENKIRDMENEIQVQIKQIDAILDARISEDFELKEAIKKYYNLDDKKKKHIIELINLLSGE